MKLSGSLTSLAPTWVVIPTYWGMADAGIYDHPTPLEGMSTLPLLLDSLIQQDSPPDFTVLILVSTTAPEYAHEATMWVRQIIAPYTKKLNLYVADITAAQFLNQELLSHDLELGIESMQGYAAVRNLQLLIPAIMDAETIIAVDDDEVLPEIYLRQATKWIGKNHLGQKITGIAGPYLNDEGSPYIAEVENVSNILIDKSVFMNETMRWLMTHPDELVKTPMALGGNMIFHRELFTQVGFDPAITRGEDIDYLLNARIAGHSFYFDSKLTIIHRPPRHFEAPEYAKMQQDIIRFMYEREKLYLYDLSPNEFLPYPGRLLNDDFIPAALEALQAVTTPEMLSKFASPEEFILAAQTHTKEYASQYATFSIRWVKAIKLLQSQRIKDELLRFRLIR